MDAVADAAVELAADRAFQRRQRWLTADCVTWSSRAAASRRELLT